MMASRLRALPVRSWCSEAGTLPLGRNRCLCRKGSGDPRRPGHSGKGRAARVGPFPTQVLRALALGMSLEEPPQSGFQMRTKVSVHVENTTLSRIQKSLRKSRNAENVDGQNYSPQHYLYAQRTGKHLPGQH